MRDLDELRRIADHALSEAKRRGAEAAEVYLTQSRSHGVKSLGAFVEAAEGNDEGIGVRVAVAGRLGHSGASGLNPENVEAVVANALESIHGGGPGGFLGFAQPSGQETVPPPIHPALLDPDPERLAAELQRALDVLRTAPDVTFHAVKIGTALREFLVANSNGLVAWDRSAGEGLEVTVRATRAAGERTATDQWSGTGPTADHLDLAAFAREVADRAREAVGGTRLDRAVDEVILLPQAASQVIGLFAASLSAKRVERAQSVLTGKLGARVAAPAFSLADQPRGPEGSGRMQVDHEGVPTQALALVDRGVLAGFLHDTQTAAAAGVPSNGHGLRGSLGGTVLPRFINAVVAAGDRPFDELLEGTRRAVLIPDTMMGQIGSNNTTGDFSFVAPFAFLVENGRVVHPLPPTTVGGNAFTVLERIVDVSSERRTIPAGTYPTLRAGGVACAN